MSDSASDWRPSATRAALAERAGLLARLRAFFDGENVLEVETPLLSRAGSPELHIDSLRVPSAFPNGAPGWLIPSPEFHLKRLVAAGYADVYGLTRVFRAGEAGRLHNPEFTLVEWYRLNRDLDGLMDDIEALLSALLPASLLANPAERIGYREAFVRHAGIDPFTATLARLREAAEAPEEADRDVLLDRLGALRVYPALGEGGISLIHGFPASQASLARIRPDEPPVAERVEAIVAGVELVNGFVELAEAGEQRQRFEADLRRRARSGREQVPLDEHFLAALQHGLPDCAGAALGFDRLVMLALGASDLSEVIAFPQARA